MTDIEQSQSEDRISFKDYLLGWLSIVWRRPAILIYTRKVFNVRVKNRESWGSMLEENAAQFPDNAAIKSEDGALTYKEFNERANRYANYFISRGLQKGDTAAVFLENRPDLLILYSALSKIGVVNSMINTNLHLDSLKHCLTLNPAKMFIVGEEVLDAFEEVRDDLGLGGEQMIYFLQDRGQKSAPKGYVDLKKDIADYPKTNPLTTAEIKPADRLAYVFTSGTTGGMPKAAIITHGRLVRTKYYNGKIILNMRPDDTMYVPLPFFHTNALALSWPAVFANGAAVAIRRKFSVSNFWKDVHKYNATAWCYIGELCRYLMNQPPKADDRDNPLQKIIGNGLRPDIWKDFKKRFGITKVYEIYGAAESNLYFVNMLNLDCTVGRCRVPYAIVKYDVDEDAPIRDANGYLQKVGTRETGLLLGEISEDNPFIGYSSQTETESKIIKDVFSKGDAWFNTGDMVRDIGFKHIQFEDRLGDTFRWKGENVSTTEVEKVANTFDPVSLSSAYGAPMPGGDGRVGMVAVIPENTAQEFDFRGLAEHFQTALPSYAVPKFVRLNTDFEYTPTHKIKKMGLKKEGFDPAKTADPIYVLLPGASAYQPLTNDIYAEIIENKYRF